MEDRNFGFKPEFLPPPSAPASSQANFNPANLNYPYPANPSIHPIQSVSTINPTNRPHNDMAYCWIDSHSFHGSVPPTALRGGIDIDGHQIYVGRAYHEGDWIPAKVIPGKNVAYICYDGEEHAVDNFQVLCERRFEWQPSSGSNLPPGAVQGGNTHDGEPLYIGRVYHEGSQTIGKVHNDQLLHVRSYQKVHLSHGSCYIPFDGQEIAYGTYEILVLRP